MSDIYPWNTRLKMLKQNLSDFQLTNDAALQKRKRERLEEEVAAAIHDFQPTYGVLIMKWANEAGIGPGFVVD